ncbi:MAG: PfkB family carbohydrate kinase [Acidimicrobiia bacterium]|nr:PfkB family carbohydrate kinase [Acidimicrobiia bacterium]
MIDFRDQSGRDERTESVCVIAPSLALSVMIEHDESGNGADIHLHPAGQGFWIARLLAQLGCRAVLCGPVGGEPGAVLETLVPMWGVEFAAVRTSRPTTCVIEDRRNGTAREVARERKLTMHRHDVDQLFDSVFELALSTAVTVVTGRASEVCVPLSFFQRLGEDLAATGVETVGDLHGPELGAFLESGRLSVLKISDEDLVEDGIVAEANDVSIGAAIRLLDRYGIGWLVVSQAERGAVVALNGRILKAKPPILRAVDHRGSGDSMTAALTAALMRGLDGETAVRLACAAGAANVTRHGLGSASAGLIEQLAEHIQIEPMEVPL